MAMPETPTTITDAKFSNACLEALDLFEFTSLARTIILTAIAHVKMKTIKMRITFMPRCALSNNC
jgi:hypothetical protein